MWANLWMPVRLERKNGNHAGTRGIKMSLHRSFNLEIPVAYNEDRKMRFHNVARTKLRFLAEALALPKGSYDIRSNKGGIAVSGEITLHAESIYVQISQSCLGGGMGILIRTCEGRKDYMGGRNHWLPLSALDNIQVLAKYVQRVMIGYERFGREGLEQYRRD
jgi:hypothetical protein